MLEPALFRSEFFAFKHCLAYTLSAGDNCDSPHLRTRPDA
jgi:hypothetical protein